MDKNDIGKLKFEFEGYDPNKTITKDELRAYYKHLEEHDPNFGLLPIPNFMIKEEPEKYGWASKNEVENIFNGLDYLKLKEEGKEEEATKIREEFLAKHPKPRKNVPHFKGRFDGKTIL